MEAQTVTSLVDLVKDHNEFIQYLAGLLATYGYLVLFFWSILEGEIGLLLGGILCYTGDLNIYMAIFVAGLGGFAGDQIYFYIGRYNKKYIQKKLHKQRRKFALAHLLLQKYGWPLIFVQRYLYGLRTIIPMAIGLTRYSAKKFAFINLLSGWVWASITIIPAYIFGEEILNILSVAKEYWFIAILVAGVFIISIWYFFHNKSKTKKVEI